MNLNMKDMYLKHIKAAAIKQKKFQYEKQNPET